MILSGPGSIALCSNSSIFTGLSFLQLRIGVPQTTEIGGAGPGIQLLEQAVVAGLGLELRDAALGIVDISEGDRLCGAGLHASRNNLAVSDAAVFLFGLNFCGVDALDAVGAFFHGAAAAHGDVGVAEAVETLRIPIRIQQEVEAADFVGAIVGTVAGADAAVVDHLVQAVAAVNRGSDRADQLARRVLALHADNRLVV